MPISQTSKIRCSRGIDFFCQFIALEKKNTRKQKPSIDKSGRDFNFLCSLFFDVHFQTRDLKAVKLTSFRSNVCVSEKPSMFMHKHEFSLQTGLYYLMCCKGSLYINAKFSEQKNPNYNSRVKKEFVIQGYPGV